MISREISEENYGGISVEIFERISEVFQKKTVKDFLEIIPGEIIEGMNGVILEERCNKGVPNGIPGEFLCGIPR